MTKNKKKKRVLNGNEKRSSFSEKISFRKSQRVWVNMTFVAINSGAQEEIMSKRSRHSHMLTAKIHEELLSPWATVQPIAPLIPYTHETHNRPQPPLPSNTGIRKGHGKTSECGVWTVKMTSFV